MLSDAGTRLSLVRGGPTVAIVALGLGLLTSPAARADVATQLELRLGYEQADPQAGDSETLIALRRFYANRGFQPLWVAASGVTEAARTLADVLARATEEGLDPADYRAGPIAERLSSEGDAELADLEYELSRALVHYGTDLSAGRVDPAQVDPEHHIEPEPIPAEKLLAGAKASGDLGAYLASLAPQSREYRRLKSALARYRELAAQGGWGTLAPGKTLKPGMREPRVTQLRQRLIRSGDLAVTTAEPDLYDAPLEAAVRFFQRHHGLSVDGAVGQKTAAALNVPVEARIEQMLLNMERRRWMPDHLGETYIFVNLADFVLKLVDGPKTILDARVVVGKPYSRTPVFSAMMRYIVINPYWTIPSSIARKEILPKLRRQPNYLAERNIRLFADWTASAREVDASTIDWASVSPGQFNFKLRQEPGEGNALGRLKFMFPNRFNVYLHDTPQRDLFEQTVRSFSHGCIRVENPARLAAVLLRDQPGWSEADIQAAITTGEHRIVNLKTPVPVHLTYLTVWVNKDQSVHFRDDIYGRDERLKRALRHSKTGNRTEPKRAPGRPAHSRE